MLEDAGLVEQYGDDDGIWEKPSHRPSYRVHHEPDGDLWILPVPGVGATQARTLDEAETMVRELVALTLEVPPGSFDVIVESARMTEQADA